MTLPRGLLVLALGLLGAAGVRAGESPITDGVKNAMRARTEGVYNASVIVGVLEADGHQEYFSLGAVAYQEDGKPLAKPDENSVFEIGSITKVFTSIVLASMVEEGTLELDDPVQSHLPESVVVPTRNGEVIRLVHLATHTSGLPRMPSNFAPKDGGNPYADYTVDNMYAFLSKYSLERDIGAKAEYSNLGVGLLGHVLSLVDNKPYEQMVIDRVLTPLSMADTRITLTPSMQQRLAKGHSGVMQVANWDLDALAGAGALRSTAKDMLKFAAANMKAVTGADKSPLSDALRRTYEPRNPFGPKQSIGLGWVIQEASRGKVLWHNGGTGGYRSFCGFRDDGSRGVVVLTNSDAGCDDIGFHILDNRLPLNPPPATVPVDRQILASYAGKYQFPTGSSLEVVVKRDHLVAQLTGQGPFTLYASSPEKFSYAVVPATLTFVKDEQGKVASVVLNQNGVDQKAERVASTK